jgi:hypothetical protein
MRTTAGDGRSNRISPVLDNVELLGNQHFSPSHKKEIRDEALSLGYHDTFSPELRLQQCLQSDHPLL